nr:MAG TPA: FIBRINOGEN ALPHA CHAIN, FIBRINOGEN BETA ADHESION, VIRULENCE FACTOR, STREPTOCOCCAL.5A [Caudoviricetes sp.]
MNKTGKSPKIQNIRFPSEILNVKEKDFEKSS